VVFQDILVRLILEVLVLMMDLSMKVLDDLQVDVAVSGQDIRLVGLENCLDRWDLLDLEDYLDRCPVYLVPMDLKGLLDSRLD
jgi:hypothetical protein